MTIKSIQYKAVVIVTRPQGRRIISLNNKEIAHINDGQYRCQNFDEDMTYQWYEPEENIKLHYVVLLNKNKYQYSTNYMLMEVDANKVTANGNFTINRCGRPLIRGFKGDKVITYRSGAAVLIREEGDIIPICIDSTTGHLVDICY